MSVFTDWFTGVFKPKQPIVIPATPVVVPVPAAGTAKIKIEHYNKNTRSWRVQDVPFASSSEVNIATATNRAVFKLRVTVLEGKLTVQSATCNGPHNPTITRFMRNQEFTTGTTFPVDCSLGAQTVNNPGRHDQVNYGVFTKELGQIIQLSAVVSYPQ